MAEDENIVKNLCNIESTIKDHINKHEAIPKNLEAVLNQAKYSIDKLSEIVKIYKVSYEQC